MYWFLAANITFLSLTSQAVPYNNAYQQDFPLRRIYLNTKSEVYYSNCIYQ
jgi:hypothetical protein